MKMRTNIFFVETPHGASLRFNNNAQRQIHFFVGNGLQPFHKMLAGGSVINRSLQLKWRSEPKKRRSEPKKR